MPLDPDVGTVVASANVSNTVSVEVTAAELAMGDAVTHQRAVIAIQEASLAVGTRKITAIDHTLRSRAALATAQQFLQQRAVAALTELAAVAARLR